MHISDIHFEVKPHLSQVLCRGFGKRIIGYTNLYGFGRSKRFTPEMQQRILREVDKHKPDVLLVTGDMTAMATPQEFELAHQVLAPVLDAVPTSFVIPGNHDIYTVNSDRQCRFYEYFGKWTWQTRDQYAARDVAVMNIPNSNTRVLGLNPNVPTFIGSRGTYSTHQLDHLRQLLESKQNTIIATHYPVLHPDSHKQYHLHDRWHGVTNADAFWQVICDSPHPPSMIVHGHIHRGFRVITSINDRASTAIHCPGAAGYVFNDEHRRTSAFNMYTVPTTELAHNCQRFVYNGVTDAFEEEQPHAYASKWSMQPGEEDD
jgi:3',5'-cyclic AMP phosphodiesterase CpdA